MLPQRRSAGQSPRAAGDGEMEVKLLSRVVGVAAVCVQAGGCATAPAAVRAPATLAWTIDSTIAEPPLHRTYWGIHVLDAASGAVLYSRNADRLFIPASNTKLVVAAVALARFGEAYRYITEARVAEAGPDGADSVRSLLVAGTGDPTWSARFHDSPVAPLDSLAVRVAGSGIRGIDTLVIDASRFRDESVHPAWEVGDLPWSYAPPVDALAIGEGTFTIEVRGGSIAGVAGAARVIGPVRQPVRATVTTDTAGAPARLNVDYLARRDTVVLSARIGAGAVDTSTLAVTSPADVAAHALAESLRGRGVVINAVRVVRESAQAASARSAASRVVATYASEPMRDVVAGIMRPSQNWIAEQVLKTLGAEYGAEGSWRGGLDVERAYLFDVVGIDSGAVNLRDASGLSAQNLLTPLATAALLAHARTQPWGGAFRDALPVPGGPGTLSARLHPLEGRLAAKTGTIANVNALSGYMTADDGRELIFVIYTNASGQPAATVRAAMDDVVLAIARMAAR